MYVISYEDDHLRIRDANGKILGTILFSKGMYMVVERPELGEFRSIEEIGKTLLAAKQPKQA